MYPFILPLGLVDCFDPIVQTIVADVAIDAVDEDDDVDAGPVNFQQIHI